MIVLSIDTCGPSGSIAIGRVEPDSVDVLAQTELTGKTYSAQMVPALRTMLSEQGIGISELNAIVVVNGPGSFTGVRIGVSSAKGLADALNIPLLAVSRLAVFAWKASLNRAALDAGRGEFYFREDDRESLLSAKEQPLVIAHTIAVCEASARKVFVDAISVEPPNAENALRYAVSRILSGDFADVATLDGNYVRRSDAEIFAKTAGKA